MYFETKTRKLGYTYKNHSDSLNDLVQNSGADHVSKSRYITKQIGECKC